MKYEKVCLGLHVISPMLKRDIVLAFYSFKFFVLSNVSALTPYIANLYEKGDKIPFRLEFLIFLETLN
jgi:hypothetical protein